MSDPHQVTRNFERALCEYTGAKYAVTVTSCTMALTLALAWHRARVGAFDHEFVPLTVTMPRLSYVGVPAAVTNAGLFVAFRDEDWHGEYEFTTKDWRLNRNFGQVGAGIWDSARRFTSGMFRPGAMQCVSFHASKILGDSQGGAILHDNDEADAWLRRARFDGRTEGADPKTDQVQWPSWHCYMSPDVAARLLWRLSVLPKHNADLPRSQYPDLSTMEAFK
jgi:dTDP-4-amino-4,6-dideoxygalactose transaminase